VCLDQIATIASARVQQDISRIAPRDAALTWKAGAVHPLQALENEYQGIVHDAVRGIDNADQRRLAEGKALAQFFFFDGGTPRLLGVGQGEAYNGEKYPFIEDKLRALRLHLKEAKLLMHPGPAHRIDTATLRLTLRAARDLAVEVTRAFLTLPDAQQWQVPPIVAATQALAGLRPHIDQAATTVEFEAIIRRISEAAKQLTEATKGLGSVQMFYVIEAFYLFRLLVRYRIESQRPLSDEAIAEASGALTGLMTNGHPWLSDWLRDKIVALSRRIAEVDPSQNTLFFLKGGRALRYLEGQPQLGENDWDTQIVINPELPPAEWYRLFQRVSNEVLLALKEFNAELYMLLHGHAAQFRQELANLPPPAPRQPEVVVEPPDREQLLDAVWDRIELADLADRQDVDNPPDQIPNRNKANCKAELIDIGLPRYDTIEALEQWRHLRGNIKLAPDMVPYPGELYYISEYLMMIREVFAGKSHSLRKAGKRIERLYAMLNLPGVDQLISATYGADVQARLPRSYAQVVQVADVQSRRALLVMLADFIAAYGLDKDDGYPSANGPIVGFAEAFDTLLAQVIPTQPQIVPYPPGVAEIMNGNTLSPGGLCLAKAICFGEQVSQWVEAHLSERGSFVRSQDATLGGLLRAFLGNSFFTPQEELEIQIAIRGSYGAWLQGSYAQSPRMADLDAPTYLSLGVYSENPNTDPTVVFDLIAPIVQTCLQDPAFAGVLVCKLDPAKQYIRLFWSSADTQLSFGASATGPAPSALEADYAALAVEFVVMAKPARPLLSYIWGLPTLSLRDMIAEYRSETANIEEYGRRLRLRETGNALIEMATRAVLPEVENPAIAALRAGRAHHLMISSDSQAVGPGGDYPASYHASQMALKVMLTDNRQALRKALTLPAPPPLVDRSLDLLVINQGHGDIGNFAHWTSDQLRQNLVKPLVDSGVRANIIVLDFCLSASLLDCFMELCAPDGVMISNVYSISEVVMTTAVWGLIEPALAARNVSAIRDILDARQRTMSADLTGFANLETVRQWSEEQTSRYLARNAFDADPISIIRYLPEIASALRAPDRPLAEIYRELAAVRSVRNLSPNDLAVLIGLPQAPGGMTQRIVTGISDQLRRRVITILTPITDPQINLQAMPLFGSDSLWDLMVNSRYRILATATGLPRCPTPFTMFDNYGQSLTLDEALTQDPLAQDIETLLMSVEPSAPDDVRAIVDQIDNDAAILLVIKEPDYLQ
jgi:hypothetical protein